jgi:hypothetical protein
MSRSKDWRRRRGVCLVNGGHRPGSPWERECPLLNQPADADSDRNPPEDPIQDRPVGVQRVARTTPRRTRISSGFLG